MTAIYWFKYEIRQHTLLQEICSFTKGFTDPINHVLSPLHEPSLFVFIRFHWFALRFPTLVNKHEQHDSQNSIDSIYMAEN